MKTTLLVMALNEIDGMKAVMPKVKRGWVDQIVVCDGGSTDGTAEWARAQGYTVHVQRQRGFRQGYYEVWPLIEGDLVVTFSPDGNSLPEKIPELVAKLKEGYDMVIASRYKGDARSDDDDVVTGFGNWLFTKTVNVLFGARYTDVMVIFRGYRKELISRLELDQDDDFAFVEALWFCGHRGTSWEPLMSVLAHKYRYRIAEIVASEPPRIGGKRKLRVINWGGAYYTQFLREFLRPLKPVRLNPKAGAQQV
ncbi:MAG: glycosyltransferase family 2 protein [Rhodospirillales bacterium]